MVIPKKIELTALGEDYKGSFLTFKSIAFKDYEPLVIRAEKLRENDKDKNTFTSLNFVSGELKSRFIEGEIVNGSETTKVSTEDILDLPGDVLVDCFQMLMGKISPN